MVGINWRITPSLSKPQCALCLHLSNKSCRNCRPCGKVTSSSPDSTPIIVFCSSVTPVIRATCRTEALVRKDTLRHLAEVLVPTTTWQSTLSMCRAVMLAFVRLKSSLSTSRTLGSRGRLFCGRSSESNRSSWKQDSNSTCESENRV